MEKNFSLKSEVFFKGVHCETQFYTQLVSERVISIHQQSEFIAEKNKKFECSFTINPCGYVRVEINSNENTLRVRLIDDNKLEVYHNGKFKEYINIHREEIVLFDGPSPILDYLNYMYFVNVENETVTRSVLVPNVITGNLIKKNYYYLKKGNLIQVKKNEEKVEIETTSEYRMVRYKNGELSCIFSA